MVKRSRSLTPTITRKRLPQLWGTPSLPVLDYDLDYPFLNLDFTHYAQATLPDVTLTNGTIEFQGHKQILAFCSSVINTLLSGDSQTNEILLRDVSDEGLMLLNSVIYAKPDADCRNADSSELSNLLGSRIPSLILIKKYNFKIIEEVHLLAAKEEFFHHGTDYNAYLSAAKGLELELLVTEVENSKIQARNSKCVDLSGFPHELLVKMLEAHAFDEDFAFFKKILKIAQLSKSRVLLDALKAVQFRARKDDTLADSFEDWSSYNGKVRDFYKAKSNIILDCLY